MFASCSTEETNPLLANWDTPFETPPFDKIQVDDFLPAFDEAIKIRELIRQNVKPGKTGREILDNLKRLVGEAGYIYTDDEHASDVKGIEVNIGMHQCGNLGHDAGGSIFEIYPVRTTYPVRPNSLFAFEFIVFTPAPEWGGNKIPVCYEENALITEKGIQWVHPPQNEILIIR